MSSYYVAVLPMKMHDAAFAEIEVRFTQRILVLCIDLLIKMKPSQIEVGLLKIIL